MKRICYYPPANYKVLQGVNLQIGVLGQQLNFHNPCIKNENC